MRHGITMALCLTLAVAAIAWTTPAVAEEIVELAPPTSAPLVPPQEARVTPIYPTDQPGFNAPAPREMPTSRDFDSTVRIVNSRCEPCGPCPSIGRCGMGPCNKGACDPCPCFEQRCSDGYAGINLQAYPGLGFGVEFGMWFARSDVVDWAIEFGMSYQDFTDGFNNIDTGESGKWLGANIGVKASFMPRCNSHPVLRAGLGWRIATGDIANEYDIGDITSNNAAINYFGGYLGIGWEWDLFDGRFTTGPEIVGFAGVGDRDNGEAYTATLTWHFLVNL